jgi:hypothetical protein
VGIDGKNGSVTIAWGHLLSMVGLISVNFVSLEYSMINAVSKLTSTDLNITVRLLSGDSFTILLKKLTRIIHYKFDDEIIKSFKEVYNSLDTVGKKRNKYIHSKYYIDKNKNIFRFKINPNSETSVVEIEKEELKTIANLSTEIKEAEKQLLLFVDEIILKFPQYFKDTNGNNQNETEQKNNQEKT